jgi:ornithine cyclodeaminase
VVDSDAAKNEVGDLIIPLTSGLICEQNILHIADLVVGKRSIDTARTTVFKSVGLALYDLYAAQAFSSEAQRLGRGTLLDI